MRQGYVGSGQKGGAIVAGPMKDSFDLADEKKFQTLRKQLTDEGYPQVLGFETLPLVHSLFGDLCALRETHATLVHHLSEKSANEAKLQRQIHPIQKELSRMVRENNQLHLELIQRGEEIEAHRNEWSFESKKLKSTVSDQAFIVAQQAEHIRELENLLDEHKGRIQELLDPSFTYTTGPAGEALPKGQEIVVSACPKPHEPEDDDGTQQAVHDLESATAEQIVMLEEDLSEARKQQELLELEVQSLKNAVRNRENEIARIGKLLVTNVNSDREDLEKINSENEDSIRRLNNQLDFVSGQLADAESLKAQLQQTAGEVEILRTNEAKLKALLADANAEVEDLRVLVLQRPEAHIEARPDGPSVAQAMEMMEQMSTTTYLLAKIQAGARQDSWTGFFKQLDKDGSGKVNKSEWRQFVAKFYPFASVHDANILFDIFDRDGGGEIEAREFRAMAGETHREASRRALMEEILQRAGFELDGAHGPVSGRPHRDTEAAEGRGQQNDGEQQDGGAADRQQLLLEIEGLKDALKVRNNDASRLQDQALRAQQELSEAQAKCEQVSAELTEMKRLRDNLYSVVWDFESQMSEVQIKIKELVSSREEKARQCTEAWDKVRALELELAAVGQGTSSSDSQERLQNAVLLDEINKYRARVQDLEHQLESADNELADWAASAGAGGQGSASPSKAFDDAEKQKQMAALGSSQQQKLSLQAELRQQTAENQRLKTQMAPMERKLAEKEHAIEELQSLMGNMDETRGQVVAQLKAHVENAQTSKQQTEMLDAEIKRLLGEVRMYEDELARSKAAIKDIDGERDALLNQLDEKTRLVRTLETRLGEALKDNGVSLADATSLQQQADMLRQALNERDAQILAMQQELQAEGQNRRSAEQLCNAKMEEARVLTADLGTMTRENQVVNDELAVVVAQRDALKRDLDEGLHRLTVAQEMMKGREKEKQDILMSYRALNDEKQRSDHNTDRVATELHQMRAQVYAREEELLRAKDTVSALEQEQQRLSIDMLALQRHSDVVSEKLLEAQDRAKADASERESLHKELAACKNVAALVERQKSDAVREGALLRDEIVALRSQCANLTAEKDLVRGTLEAEKGKVRTLEDLLQSLRAKEHAAVHAEQAVATDNVGLHQRLQTALSENEKNAQELRLLRSRREELEYELDRHRRRVSHEAMDKDSATSELSVLKANLREMSFVVEQQNSALQAKQEEITLQRERLVKIQAEAEANERRVRELDMKLRMSQDENKVLQLSARQHGSSLEQHTVERDELRSALQRTEDQLDKMHSQVPAKAIFQSPTNQSCLFGIVQLRDMV
jgi:chromosome segregation ATPase